MTKEDDIKRFAFIGDSLNHIREPSEASLVMHDLFATVLARSQLYLEFLAGAFLKETGLKASEAELICEIYDGMNGHTISWHFQKRKINE
jgi:hypothetical protein